MTTWQHEGGTGSMSPEQETEHVFLVAVTVRGKDRVHAEARLLSRLPSPDPGLTSWWIAEDDRIDGSDNDSAVFIRKGNQMRGFVTLNDAGLTPQHNNPRRQRAYRQPE